MGVSDRHGRLKAVLGETLGLEHEGARHRRKRQVERYVNEGGYTSRRQGVTADSIPSAASRKPA
jgi:hypothetical protein